MTEESLDIADPFDAADVAQARSRQVETQDQRVVRAQQALRERRDAYLRFFKGAGSPGDHRLVMEDLRKFCRGGETPWDNDPRVHALLTGRFEVWNRLRDHLELPFDELWERYGGKDSGGT